MPSPVYFPPFTGKTKKKKKEKNPNFLLLYQYILILYPKFYIAVDIINTHVSRAACSYLT